MGSSRAALEEQQPLQMAQQEPREDVSVALAHCIYLDLGNHLSYRPLPPTCVVCASFSNRIKIQRTNRFIKSCFSPRCTCQLLLSLPRDTARGFVSPSSFQLLACTAGATKAPCRAASAWPSPSQLRCTAPTRRGQVGVT